MTKLEYAPEKIIYVNIKDIYPVWENTFIKIPYSKVGIDPEGMPTAIWIQELRKGIQHHIIQDILDYLGKKDVTNKMIEEIVCINIRSYVHYNGQETLLESTKETPPTFFERWYEYLKPLLKEWIKK